MLDQLIHTFMLVCMFRGRLTLEIEFSLTFRIVSLIKKSFSLETIIFATTQMVRLKILGFQSHKKVLKQLEKASISVVCSRWNEPFGRTSLEAASRGCCVIISNRGGLKETITNGAVSYTHLRAHET